LELAVVSVVNTAVVVVARGAWSLWVLFAVGSVAAIAALLDVYGTDPERAGRDRAHRVGRRIGLPRAMAVGTGCHASYSTGCGAETTNVR